jgi:4-diphosphocytidyl-2-C-methyl-D-erythritol kinase
MVVFPSCKINLGLQITGKRADGYHELITCFYPVPWYDILEVIPAKEFFFTTSGIPVPGNSEENLCVEAYRMLQHDLGLPPVAIHLHKIIPMGAGLGGGSSDAAWTLRALDQVLDLKLSEAALSNYASRLGSDCAFFIQNNSMLGTGRGEILKSIDVALSGKFLVLVKPNVHISTVEAYAGIKPRPAENDLKETLENTAIGKWRDLVKNDFEESVFKKFPMIADIKNLLYKSGALYASMSGSGSAVFGVFSVEVDLRKHFQTMIYWSGRL